MPALQDAPGPRERTRLQVLLSASTTEAARGLIGQVLVRRRRGTSWAARIVETEAYLGEGDPAAHVFRGRTPRTEPLYGMPGTLYVYFIYGVHHCLNLAVDGPDAPGCVLIRAAEPLPGAGLASDTCRGPGRLCRALDIDRRLSGRHVFEEDPPLTLREGAPPRRVKSTPRVGIRHATGKRLRFLDPASLAVSSRRPGVV